MPYEVKDLNQVMSAAAELMGSAQRFFFPPSPYPDTIHFLANWNMIENDRIYVGQQIQDNKSVPSVNFGDVEMYPWPFRNKNQMDYVQIDGFSPSGQYTQGAIDDLYYCYAMEAILHVSKGPNGAFLGYSGYGALTMAYNKNAETTADYQINGSQLFPTLHMKVANSEEVDNPITLVGGTYIQLYLKPYVDNSSAEAKKKNKFKLTVALRSVADRKANVEIPIFTHIYSIDWAEDFQNSISEGGVGGTVTNPSSDGGKTAFTIRDVQLIMPDDDFLMGGDDRMPFIEKYAFPWSLMDKVVLKEQLKLAYKGFVKVGQYNAIFARAKDGSGVRPTVTKTPAGYSQAVTIPVQINYELQDGTYVWKQWDLAQGRYIPRLAGGISLRFIKSGGTSVSVTMSMGIEWKYTEEIFYDPSSGSPVYRRGTDLVGKGASPSSYPPQLLQDVDKVAASASAKLKAEMALVRNDKTAFQIIYGDYSGGTYAIPTDQDIDAFIAEIKKNLTSAVTYFKLLSSYVMYKPQGQYDHNEILFITGNFDSNISGSLDSNNLLNASYIQTILRSAANEVSSIPQQLYGRITAGTMLNSWNSTSFRDEGMIKLKGLGGV